MRQQYTWQLFLTILLLMLFSSPAFAASEEPALRQVTLDQVAQGGLLLKTSQPGIYLEAPTIDTAMRVSVAGIVARTTVTQKFHNPTSHCVEGIYVFPLPENSAVDQMHLSVGGRVIEGQIKAVEEARKVYEKAREEGKHASLVEQQRPNLFTTSVASLAPGEDVEVEIAFQQTLRYDHGSYELRLPLVVAPRYMPAADQSSKSNAPSLPENVTVPYRADAPSGLNPVELSVDLHPGFAIRKLQSPSHVITQSALGPSHYEVHLASATTPADRDFRLSWEPDLGNEPRVSYVDEIFDGSHHGLLMVMPPADSVVTARVPRETIFVMDTSGSMEGESIRQARQALLTGLGSLHDGDSFNVVEFSSEARQLFDASVDATPENLAKAHDFVEALRTTGGTEMLPALQLALSHEPNREVRQVIFVTDGQAGNEAEIFSYLKSHLGTTRLFTVGIGSAPNSYFLSGAARMGAGTFTFIGNLNEVAQKMGELFHKLESPVLTSVRVETGDPEVQVEPSQIPDVYAGEPLVISLKSAHLGRSATITGQLGGRPWSATVALVSDSQGSGIARLWARRRIESLMDSLTAGGDAIKVKDDVLKVALDYHLVSQFTSLVAVDMTPSAFGQAGCRSELIPLNQPAGWGDADPEGSLPRTATPANLLLLLGGGAILLGFVLRRLAIS
ncbi:MAG TPA: marine proteobacterial sortase target protein [Thermoanaerobaculia bacterium]|nr:marine proteobacterial sortase target protein [Thermoanaerobaculia bacterium]